MKLIICLDDTGGMLFNRRRQSRDAELCRRVVELAAGSRLWMSPYSAVLFAEHPGAVTVVEAPCQAAASEEYCFVEAAVSAADVAAAEEIVIYRWNRRYPADVKLPAEALTGRQLIAVTAFPGSSHDKITEEIYR